MSKKSGSRVDSLKLERLWWNLPCLPLS